MALPSLVAAFARPFLMTFVVVVAAMQAVLAWQHGAAAAGANLRHLVQETVTTGVIQEHAPDEYDAFLRWIDANTSAHATLLLLQPAQQPDTFRYFRTSFQAYPRTVWWGDGQVGQPYPDWHVPVDPASVLGSPLLTQRHIDYLVVDGLAPSSLALPAALPLRWYSQRLAQYLVVVRPEPH